MIFADTAPAYFAAGLPVIPLYRKEKRPVPLDWSRYHDQPVEPEVQQNWLAGNAQGNIGLVLGKQSGIVMLDIDTEDEALIGVILDQLPKSPWKRIGQKGMVLAFRYSGTRTFRIKNEAGESICELLSERTQCVLPPSIHPKTGRPYIANCDLLTVVGQLPVLNPQIEQILRGALKEAGVSLAVGGQSKVTEYVSRGSRDVSMTEKAGLFAFAVTRGERSVKEAIGMLMSYHTEYVEEVAGDNVGAEKHIAGLLRFLRRDVLEKGRVLPDGWDDGLSDQERVDWGLEFDKDQLEWSFEDMRSYLVDQFEAHSKESQARADAIDKVLRKIAASQSISKLDEERMLQYITDVSGTGLRITSLRARMRELREGDVAGTDHSEIAREMLKSLEETYVVRRHGGSLWKYTGSHWEAFNDAELLAKISNEFGHLSAARKHGDHKGILATVMNLAEEGIKEISTRGVNFANGFLNEQLDLVDHDAGYGMTYTLPFRYLPELNGKSFMFFDFLKDCWGKDPDYEIKVMGLQEALCATLFGMGARFQRVILLKGVARSGKSQMLKIAQSLVPMNAKCFVPPNEWSDRFMPTQMHEKLINVCGELSESKRIDGQSFKDIVDGAEMSGQFKGQQIFKFRPVCTHWFASNHSPKTDDTSEGFNRRWLMFEFNHPISAAERKIDIGDTIVAEEREAIVAWAVQAVPRLEANREYTLSSSHEQLIREVAQANNSVRFFMEESPVVQVGNSSTRISEDKLYKEYWAFCLGPGGVRAVSSRKFRSAMRELQSHLGFQLVLEKSEMGSQEVFYQSVTVVEKKRKSS